MKYLWFRITLFALLPMLFFAQAPDTLWTRTYGGSEDDDGKSILLTSDGGYIFVGTVRVAGNRDAWIVRTDSLGDTLWTKTYEGAGVDGANSIQYTADSGYIIVGYTGPSGIQAGVWLLKIDANGDTLWTKAIQPLRGWGNDVKQTSDGGYIITGTSGGHPPLNSFLTKTDSLGETLWTRVYRSDNGNSVQETSNGNYIMCASVTPYIVVYSAFVIVKINPVGDTLWTKEYGDSTEHNSGDCILETTDNGFIACGQLAGDICLLRTDANGDTLWTTRFDYNGNDYEYGSFLDRTSDGGYIIVGHTAADAVILKTDSLGNIQWTKVLGDSLSDCRLLSVRQTADNGYIAIGNTNASGAGGFDAWLVKFEPDVNVKENKPVVINKEITATIFRGPIHLPKDKQCRVFDITGRVVAPERMRPGIYFIEIDGRIKQKIVKIR